MSLSKLNKIDIEKGAIFDSHVDGKNITVRGKYKIQLGLNSDIVMIMDECPKTDDYELIKKSMNLSLNWAKRSKKHLVIILIKLYLELSKEVF